MMLFLWICDEDNVARMWVGLGVECGSVCSFWRFKWNSDGVETSSREQGSKKVIYAQETISLSSSARLRLFGLGSCSY